MWRNLLREWIAPPGVLRLWRAWRTPATQKFWNGTPLPPSPAEGAYFSSAGHKALTLTRADDSRNAALLTSRATLPLAEGPASQVQLAVAADAWQDTDRVKIASTIDSVEHTGVLPGDWLDIRIACAPGTSEQVTVQTTSPLFCSMPRRVATAPTRGHSPRHVVVLVLDGLTPHLSLEDEAEIFGGPAAPNIERFFSSGFAAANGWSSGEWTLPTTASFFTGLYTSRHRMYHPIRPTYAPDRPMLAEVLQRAGYHSLALSTANRLTPAFGSHRGFDRFIYHWPYPGRTVKDYDPARWCDEIMGHLDTHVHDRTFVYAQFPDTHPAWNVAPLTRSFNLQRRGSSTGRDLDALNRHPDGARQGKLLNALRLHELDRLLSALFLFVEKHMNEESLVVLTADHGTPWSPLRARRPADEPYLVDQRTRVELRMRGAGVPARRFDGLCSPNIDLMPTLLKRLGLEFPGDLDGRDLLAPDYARRAAISESIYGGVYELAVRDGRRTYVEKFAFDDDSFSLKGSAHYRKCFPAGTFDYGRPLEGEFDDLAGMARAHRLQVGLGDRAA
jgi:arylsulfatase A-like enzyme